MYQRLCTADARGPDGLVLGIESSCDDTGVAVVRASDGAILGQAVTGQVYPLPVSQAHRSYQSSFLVATFNLCSTQEGTNELMMRVIVACVGFFSV